jgi:hypothetical protein
MKTIPFLLVFLLTFSCASKHSHMDGKKVVEEGVLSISGPSIDGGDKRFSGNLTVKNQSGSALLVYLHDIKCNQGKVDGFVKNPGNRRINIPAGAAKALDLECVLPKEAEGKRRFNLSKVFQNPNGDGKTSGKMIAKNIVWEEE